MATAPTYVGEIYEANWSSTTSPKTSTSLSVTEHDLLVVVAGGSSSNGALNISDSAGLTWTTLANTTGSRSPIRAYRAEVATTGTLTITITRASGSSYYGFSVILIRNHGGVGATNNTANGTGAPSFSFTTQGANSSVVYINGDINSGSSSGTWRTTGVGAATVIYEGTPGATFHSAIWQDVGAAGSKTLGLTAPTQTWSAIAIEVKASATINVAPTGIASAEAFGAPTISMGYVAQPTGIASGEAFGSPTVSQKILPDGIASGEAFGSPTVTAATRVLSPSSVADSSGVGTPTVTRATLAVSPSGISSAESFGTPTLTRATLVASPSSVADSSGVGTPTVTRATLVVSPSGVASALVFGTPTVTPATLTLSPSGVGSALAFGTITVTPATRTLSPGGIASAEALGTPALTTSTLLVSPSSVGDSSGVGSPTVSVGSWQQIVWSVAFVEAIESPSRTVGWRVELIDAGDRHVIDVPVIGGNVDFSGDTPEQWACSLSVPGAEWVPRRDNDYLGPVSGLRCRIWWQIQVLGGMVETPLSTYVLEDPRVSADGSGSVITTVSGRDPLAIIRRTGYGSATVSLGGMAVPAALARILSIVAPRAPYRIDSTSTVTLPAVYEVGDRDVLEDMTAIANLAGLHVRTDREGIILIAPIPEPSTLRADWQEGANCAVISLSRDVITSQMINSVTVTSTNSEVVPPVAATVEDDDPASPTYVGGLWGRRSRTVRSDVVATQAGAESMALAELQGSRRPTETVTITIPARGDLVYRDLGALHSDLAGVGGLYRIKSWQMTITAGTDPPAAMSVKMMTRMALG